MAPYRSGTSLAYESDQDVALLSTFEKRGYRTKPILFVNGKRVTDEEVSRARPNQTLLAFLRDVMLLKGSKLGCAEGGCGACTVMISKRFRKEIKHFSVNACLMPVLAADGCHVTTVEGIGTVKGNNLHPIQRAMVDMHGSQCGFCTPGIIVALYALFANNATSPYIEEHLDGNLCRCTGYRPIWDAARSLCDDEGPRGKCGTLCRECPERDECEVDFNKQDKNEVKQGMFCSTNKDKESQCKEALLTKAAWLDQPNAMFPDELLTVSSEINKELQKSLVVVNDTGISWFQPNSLSELLGLLREFMGDIKIVIGNTEVGIETKFKHAVYPRLVCPSESIDSLFTITARTTQIEIGSCVPLSSIQEYCESVADKPESRRTVEPIHNMLRWFASSQIRNVACLGGNLVTASPISDMNPVLMSMNATLVLSSLGDNEEIKRRKVPVSDFFRGYRTVRLEKTEIVETVEVPVLNEIFEYAMPFKQARRREDDISIVSAGMFIRIGIRNKVFFVEDARLAFGGMAPTTVMAIETALALKDSEFIEETFEKARSTLLKELFLGDAVPGGQEKFRMTLAASFLHKFFLGVAAELQKDVDKIRADPNRFNYDIANLPPVPAVDEKEMSGSRTFVNIKKPVFKSKQAYPRKTVAQGLEDKVIPKTTTTLDQDVKEVGKGTPHMSAQLHCSGEAVYTDDIPLPPLTLQAAMILSTKCGITFESMNTEIALETAGVVAVYTCDDLINIGGNNELGSILKDETVFLPIGGRIDTIGQVLGVVVAETLESAELGVRRLDIKYGEIKEKQVVSIEDAISKGSFYDFFNHSLERGDMNVINQMSDSNETSERQMKTVSGSFRVGGQDHFYLETNSALAVPSESNTNMTIYCSTQAPSQTQLAAASSTGIPAAKVVVRMKRMGGGFGGKETRSIFASCVAAVSAKLSSRPVRLTLGRDTDMCITGGRHSFVAHYKASANLTSGGAKLHALDVKLYSNGGYAFDLSGPVMDRALFHIDNCYMWPHFRATGSICKTVQPPHTAFRGFGGPQGMAVTEHIIDHLSVACNVPGDTFRRDNIYQIGQATPFGMKFGEQFSGKWNVPTMWDRLQQELNVPLRRSNIEDFNAKNKWVKRGIAFIPTKFGIAFTAKFMNQGGALVHLYTDGTVLVTHGGTEMGQGLHTKVCQVAAEAFGIPIEKVYVNDSSTDKVANTIPTAASMSTDTYGMATLDACRQILARIKPIRDELGEKATLREVASKAHMARIDLSAHGFFALDDSRCGYDWDKAKPDNYPSTETENSWKGHPFNYFTQGIACTEVEIEVLTGNHRVLRSDVLVDVGSSINPTIDIGQIEGAYIQGMGWSTIEEVVFADNDHTWIRPTGKLFTSGPGTYKIPAFNDVPEIFNVTLMEGVENPFAVHSSKAVGEPPFFLGASVFFAIKQAVRAARLDAFHSDEYFEMRMPATSERVRMYCADEIAASAEKDIKCFQPKGSY